MFYSWISFGKIPVRLFLIAALATDGPIQSYFFDWTK